VQCGTDLLWLVLDRRGRARRRIGGRGEPHIGSIIDDDDPAFPELPRFCVLPRRPHARFRLSIGLFPDLIVAQGSACRGRRG
jgi:hypothetical protein